MPQLSRFQGRLAYKWWVTIAVTLGMLMSMMDMTIVNVAIPQMQHAFGADIHDVQWVTTVYMLTQAAVIPTAPYLSARFGEKQTYVWVLSAFLLGSLLCGFAWNLPSLVFFRFVQGIGGGILLPMVMTLQYQAFPVEERGLAGSVMGVPLQLAPVLGPVLGGYLVTSFGWQWAFFINVPLGIIGVVMAQRVLRQPTRQQPFPFDGAGFVTAALGSVSLVYAISSLTSGAASLWNGLLLCVGIGSLCAFVLVELAKARRGRQPLLNVRRFKDRTFAFSVLALVFASMVMFGLLFLLPIYLQTLHGESALSAGAIQMAEALALLATLPLAGRLTDKIGPRPIALAGSVVLAGAAALMMTLGLDTPIWLVVLILVVFGIALALTFQIPVAAMSRIKQEQQQEIANGSTLISVIRGTAAPLGVALLSSIVQARTPFYTAQLAARGLAGTSLRLQSSLLATHNSYLVASILALVGLGAMLLVPRIPRREQPQPVPAPVVEAGMPAGGRASD